MTTDYPRLSSDTAYFPGASAAAVTIDDAITVGSLCFNYCIDEGVPKGTATITLTFSTYSLTVSGTANFGSSGGTSNESNVTLVGNGTDPDELSGSGQLIINGFDDAQAYNNTITFEDYASIYLKTGSFYIDHTGGTKLTLTSSDKTGLLRIGASVAYHSAIDSVTVNDVTVIVDGYTVTSAMDTSNTMTVSVSASVATSLNLYYTADVTRSGTSAFTIAGTSTSYVSSDVTTATSFLTKSSSSGSFTISMQTPVNAVAGDTITLKIYLQDGFSLIGSVTYTYGGYVWTGTISSAWNNNNNWSGGTIPDPGSTVYIPSVATHNPEILPSVSASAATLIIENGGFLTVASGGTLTAGSFTVQSGGKATQLSGGKITVSTMGVDFGGTLSLGGTLTVTNLSVSGTMSCDVVSTVKFSGAASSLYCASPAANQFGSLTITGGAVLTANSNIYLAGNWTGDGTFSAGARAVYFTDSSVTSLISGNTTFYNLTCAAAGKTLTFASGTTQTVSNTCTITGSSGNLIRLISASSGSQWTLDAVIARTSVSYAFVQDSKSTNASIAALFSSTGGNNTNWTIVQDYTWTGSGASAGWTVANNWKDGNGETAGYPGMSTDDTATVPVAVGSYYPVYSDSADLSFSSLAVTAAAASVSLSSSGNLKLAAASPLSNMGNSIYSDSGRITDMSGTPINDVTKGTVTYTGSGGTVTDFGSIDYYNLVISGTGTYSTATAISVAGTLSVSSVVNMGSLSVTGTASIGAAVTTTGVQTYNDAVAIAADATLTAWDSGAKLITFNGTVSGSFALVIGTVAASPTNVSFADTVSGLTSLTVSGASRVDCTSMRTTGAQTYSGAVTLGADAAFTANDGSTASLVTFASAVGGGTTGYSLACGTGTASSSETNVSFNGTAGGTGSLLTSLTVYGTASVGSSSSVSTTGVQTYYGAVTNTGTITVPPVATGGTGVSFEGSYSGSGTLAGSGTTDPYIDFYGDVTMGIFTANGDIVRFCGSAAQTVAAGASTYGTIVCTNAVGVRISSSGITTNGNVTVSGSLDLKTNNPPFSQTAEKTFTVETGGTVTVGTGTFESGDLAVAGTFTQTGANTGSLSGTSGYQYAGSITESGTGTVTWDSGSDGGYLSLGGNVTTSGTGSILFNHKSVTFTANVGFSGTVYDLIIPDGVTVTNNGGITVIRNFVLSDNDGDSANGIYTDAGNTLYLGGNGSGEESAAGTIADYSTSTQDLGTVIIDGGGQTAEKTAAAGLKVGTLTVAAGTLDLHMANAALTVTGSVTNSGLVTFGSGQFTCGGNLVNNGTLTGGTGNWDINGNYSGTGAAVTAPGGGASSSAFFNGNVDLSGTAFNANGGTVVFDGTGARTLMIGSSGTTFAILTIAQTAATDSFTVNTSAQTLSAADIEIDTKGTVTCGTPVETQAMTLRKSGGTTFNGKVTVSGVTAGSLADTAVAGDITFNGGTDAAAPVTFLTSGTVTLGNGSGDNCVFTGGVTHTDTALRTTVLAGTLTTTGGTVTFDNLVLASDSAVTTGTLTGGNIIINGTVSNGTAYPFVLTAGTGAVQLTGNVGTTTVPLGALTVTGTGIVADGTVTAASVTMEGGTVALNGAVTTGAGDVGISSSGTTTVTAAVTTTTGKVMFGDSTHTGALTMSGNVTTAGVTADGSGTVVFTNAVFFAADSSVDTTGAGTSTGGAVTFGSTVNGSGTGGQSLTVSTGTGDLDFIGAVGGTGSGTLSDMTVTDSGALSFAGTLHLSGSLVQTNAAKGPTTFVDTVIVDSADLKGTSFTVQKNFSVSSGDMVVTNSELFFIKESAGIILTSGNFTQNGVGLNQLAGGIKTSGTHGISFLSDVYLTGSGLTLGGGTGAITVGSSGGSNLHIVSSGTVSIDSPLLAYNIALYSGTLVFGSNCTGLTTVKDLILLKGTASAMYKDDVALDGKSGVSDLFAYKNSGRIGKTAAISLNTDTSGTTPESAFPQTLPDGTSIDQTAYSGAIDGSKLGGKTITVGQNFYDNGVDMDADSQWMLHLKDNGKATDAFAEAYNCKVSWSRVSCSTAGGTAWVAAGEACGNEENNTDQTDTGATCGWAFSRPVFLVNNSAKATDMAGTANLSGTYTVYDDVIRVEFVDSKNALRSLKIENSNNEISAAVAHISFDGGTVAFTGSYADAGCTQPTDGRGDLSVFFLKTDSTSSQRWNTDANGVGIGGSESTDRGRSSSDAAAHRSVIPDIDIKKALSGVYATLRDCHKNRIGNYTGVPSVVDTDSDGDGTNDANASPGGRFTAVFDRCAPVLVAVRTGQELHTAYNSSVGASSQPAYDSHNFIEFQYSEPVDIGDLPASPSDGSAVENKQSESSFTSASQHGGAIVTASGGNGLTVTGFASIASGSVSAGNSATGLESTIVHSLYRKFSTTVGGAAAVQAYRIRIAVAGYASGVVTVDGNNYRNWVGYIASAVLPAGTVVPVANNHITDTSVNGNPVDATGSSNHELSEITVDSTVNGLYGFWDTTPPSFAPFRANGTSWDSMSNPSYYEAVGSTTSGNTMLDRIEFHMFDNAPKYTTAGDPYTWFSKAGWSSSNNASAIDSPAADIIGGSRPFATTGASSGGIRYCTLHGASSAFTYTSSMNGSVSKAFNSAAVTAGAQGILFLPSNGTSHSTGSTDGLYYAVYLSETDLPLRTTFTVQFKASDCYMTDLAGNRISTDVTVRTIDRTPPEFNMTVSPVGQNQLYIVFSKRLNTDTFRYYTSSSEYTVYEALEYIPKALEITTGSGAELSVSDTPATVVFSNDDATGLLLTLNRNTVLSDITGGIYVKARDDVPLSIDPLAGMAAKVTYIQDAFGNYMTAGSEHAFSDFAVNVVNPLYAYDNRKTSDDTDITSGLYEDGSWAVHDWNADQQNYGTLLADHDIFISTKLSDGTSDNSDSFPFGASLYLDNSPDSDSVSTEYNTNTGSSWRIWLPGVTSGIFKNLAPVNNADYITAPAGTFPDSNDRTTETFSLPVTTDGAFSGWSAGDQVSFLFALTDSSGNLFTVQHEADGTVYPLYALRLKNSKDITSLDLWSFKLKDLTRQRGGVTVLNNVIDVNKGENAVVEVNMPSSGTLNVMVMTLDGNIVTYLQHGRTSKGLHYYRWNGKNNAGNKVARGLYFVRVIGPDIDETRKVMCVKE